MIELHRKVNESPESWLARLQAIDQSRLPRYRTNALILSIGYARHMVYRSQRQDEAPEWSLIPHTEAASLA